MNCAGGRVAGTSRPWRGAGRIFRIRFPSMTMSTSDCTVGPVPSQSFPAWTITRPEGISRPPGQVERHAGGRAALAGDGAQLAVGQVEQGLRVTAPGRRVGDLEVDLPRLSGGDAVLVHGPDPQGALHDEGHRRAVGGVDRSVLAPRADRLERRGLGVGQRARGHVHGEDLARPLAEAAGVGLEGGDREGLAVLEPAGLRGREQSGRSSGGRPRWRCRARRWRRSGPGRRAAMPSGDQAEDTSAPTMELTRCSCPGLEIEHVEVLGPGLVRGVGDALPVRRPGGVALVVAVAGELLGLLADPHHPELVQGLEDHPGPVGRERRARRCPSPDASRRESKSNCFRGSARAAAGSAAENAISSVLPPDDVRDPHLAVGRVEQPVRREPGDVEGEHVGAGAHLLAGHHEGALVGRELLVRHPRPVGRHHRRVEPEAGGRGDQGPGVARAASIAWMVVPTAPVPADEDDLLSVRGPARLELVRRARSSTGSAHPWRRPPPRCRRCR